MRSDYFALDVFLLAILQLSHGSWSFFPTAYFIYRQSSRLAPLMQWFIIFNIVSCACWCRIVCCCWHQPTNTVGDDNGAHKTWRQLLWRIYEMRSNAYLVLQWLFRFSGNSFFYCYATTGPRTSCLIAPIIGDNNSDWTEHARKN